MKKLLEYKKIHMVGIGGIGMSAMAKYLCHHSIQVTGSDLVDSKIIEDLRKSYDIPVYIGVLPENITDNHEALVYSPAIPEHNIERQEARNKNIPEYSYPELLGLISKNSKTIAISGTNGKTTTTAMVLEIMKYLGSDPTGIVGAMLQKYNSNFVAGQSNYFVTEACEYKESFLHIHHDILAITNITEDHLDYFENLEHIQNTFTKFLHNKKETGVLVCNTTLPALQGIIKEATKTGMKIIPYEKHLNLGIELSLPGEHNKENAATALGIIESLGLNVQGAREYLSKHFAGAKRRMEYIGITTDGAIIIDDYAHNPEGLEYLITGLRDFYPNKKIIMLFEPHLYSRTRDFAKEFAKELSQVDILYLFATYRAREKRIVEEDFLLVNYIKNDNLNLYLVTEPQKFVKDFLSKKYNNDYIIVSAGAGDIWKYAEQLKKSTR